METAVACRIGVWAIQTLVPKDSVPKPQKHVNNSPKPLIIAIKAIILHTFGAKVAVVAKGLATGDQDFKCRGCAFVG